MRVTLHVARRATYADYLAVEQLSAHRHELLDGVVVAMPGGTVEHHVIAGQLAMGVGARLSAGCRYYASGQRFWIAASNRARYADGSVICGPPEHPDHDAQATTNPRIVVEVASPSSEATTTATSASTSSRCRRSRPTCRRARTRGRSRSGGDPRTAGRTSPRSTSTARASPSLG